MIKIHLYVKSHGYIGRTPASFNIFSIHAALYPFDLINPERHTVLAVLPLI